MAEDLVEPQQVGAEIAPILPEIPKTAKVLSGTHLTKCSVVMGYIVNGRCGI